VVAVVAWSTQEHLAVVAVAAAVPWRAESSPTRCSPRSRARARFFAVCLARKIQTKSETAAFYAVCTF